MRTVFVAPGTHFCLASNVDRGIVPRREHWHTLQWTSEYEHTIKIPPGFSGPRTSCRQCPNGGVDLEKAGEGLLVDGLVAVAIIGLVLRTGHMCALAIHEKVTTGWLANARRAYCNKARCAGSETRGAEGQRGCKYRVQEAHRHFDHPCATRITHAVVLVLVNCRKTDNWMLPKFDIRPPLAMSDGQCSHLP